MTGGSDNSIRLVNFHPVLLSRLYALDRRCFRPGIAWSLSELTATLTHRQTYTQIAVDESGSLLGFATLELPSKDRPARVLTIDVDPQARRRSIGSLLLFALENAAMRAGAYTVELEVAKDDEGAQAFYRHQGYQVFDEIENYYMNGIDALRMQRVISRKV